MNGKKLAGIVLCAVVMLTACSTAWIGEIEQIIAVMIPGIANVLKLVGALRGQNISAEDLQKIQGTGAQAEADLQLIDSLIAQYQKADATGQSGLLSQIQVEVSAVQSNLSGLLTALHIKDAATQGKVTAIVALLVSEVQSVATIVPMANSSGSPTMTVFGRGLAQVKVPLTAAKFVSFYNATITAKTGDDELDRATARLQIHLHGKFARWATAGLLK